MLCGPQVGRTCRLLEMVSEGCPGHGSESSLLSLDSLRKLRSSICWVVWSRRQLLASVGAVLSLLDGPTGCDPLFCVVWFRFGLFRWYLALWPSQVGRAYRLLELVGEGSPGHGSHFIFSPLVLLRLDFGGILSGWAGLGLGCLCLVIDLALCSILRLLFFMPGAARLQLIFAVGSVSGGGPLLDILGSLQLLDSAHVRERDKALLRSVMVGGVWNGFLLGRVRGSACSLSVLWCSRW